MKTKLCLFTEGKVTTALLERMVACHPRMREQGVEFDACKSHGSASSYAVSTVMRWRLPVAEVVNADTSPEPLRLQRWGLQSALMRVAPPDDWRVIILEPNVEGLLLRQRGLVRELIPGEPSAEQLERARTEPRQVLAELYAQAGHKDYPQALLRRLAEVDPSPLWASPELHPLEEFLLEKLYAPPPPRLYPPPAELPPKPRSESVDSAPAS